MEGILKQTVRDFSKVSEIVQTIIIALLAFLVPTFLAKLITSVFGTESVVATNSQLIVGSIVNTMLVLTALNLKGWGKTLLVVTMPSVSTILSGYVFKSASVFMVYMIPAIWVNSQCPTRLLLQARHFTCLSPLIVYSLPAILLSELMFQKGLKCLVPTELPE